VHHRTVERLAAGDSLVHRIDPRVKWLLVLSYVIGLTLIPPDPLVMYAPAALLVLAGLMLAKLPFGFVLKRTLLVLPFVGLVAVFLPFTRGKEVFVSWPAFGIVLYREGLVLALSVLLKGVLAILAVGWLVFTTPFTHLLLALRSFRVPKLIVSVLSFLFRYLDLLADESLRVRRARSARCPEKKIQKLGRSTGGMVGNLMLRTLDRAERIHRAMRARAFDGEIRSVRRLSFRKADALIFGAAVVLMAFTGLSCRWLGGL
jgi:cobalt/nickel transport system permease protein